MSRLLWTLCVCTLASAARPETINVRILTPLSSAGTHAPDEPIEAMLIKPLIRDGQILMPSHTLLHGSVRHAKAVGIGLRHERAALEIGFTSWEDPDGNRIALDATPLRVDNAREQVDKNGRIQGILAASNPLGIVRGVWYKPSANLFLRAPAGLSGGGTVWAKLALGPAGALGLLGARLLITRMPDPEIDLPAGTEMKLRVNSDELGRSWGVAPRSAPLDAALEDFLKDQPVQVQKADGTQTQDIINVALIGSAAEVQEAFHAAGWVAADPLDRGSFARTYTAFTQRQGYTASPVSKLYYEGRLPDLVFQKSLNSIAKRHHIRLWRVLTDNGEEAWLGAATHDITVVFDRRNFGLSHKIDLRIDLERQKVMGDLDFVGALQLTSSVPRVLAQPGGARTDGALAVARLTTPVTMVAAVNPATRHGPKLGTVRRFTRRMMLEARQYVLRENAYYMAYSAGRRFIVRPRPVLEAALTGDVAR